MQTHAGPSYSGSIAEKQEPTQLDRIEKSLSAEAERSGRLEKKVDGLAESVDVLARHLKPLPDQVARIDARLTKFQAETEANFIEVNDKVDTLETTVRRHGAELGPRRSAA